MKTITKKSVTIILLVLLAFSILAICKTEAEISPDSISELHIDSSGVFRARTDKNRIIVEELYPSESSRSYTLSESAVCCCVFGGRVFAVAKSEQFRNTSVLYELYGGNIKRTEISGVTVSGSNCAVAADSEGRIYIINRDSRVSVVKRNGDLLGETKDRYYGLTTCGKGAYAANQNGLFRLDKTSARRVNSAPESYILHSPCGELICDSNGNVYDLNGNKPKLNCKHGIAFLGGCYITYENGSLVSYDSETLEEHGSFEIDAEPTAVFGFNNKIVILFGTDDSLKYKTYNPDIFKKETDEKSDKHESTPSCKRIDFGDYEVKGSYIFVPPNTTRSEFKGRIRYEGYEPRIEGKRTNHIGTGLRLILTGNGTTKSYTFILPADSNGTGEVNGVDIDLLFDHLLKNKTLKGIYKTAADMNRDGKISNADLVLTDRIRNR